MALDHADLCKRAAEYESESEKTRFDPPFVSALEALLRDAYDNMRPRPSDYEQRRLLVEMFNTMAKDIFGYFLNPIYRYASNSREIVDEVRVGLKAVIKRLLRNVNDQIDAITQIDYYNQGLGSFGDTIARHAIERCKPGSSSDFPIMEVFGSFIMDLFTARSDLDLSLNFSNDYTTVFPRDKKIPILKKFAKSLFAHQRQGKFSGVAPIMSARVPVLKVVDCQTGIECDISVENKDGMSRSSILKIISSMDERFLILSYLMKIWAKAHNINSSRARTMNSLAIISLVAFHLQTRDPPILPPFSMLFKDGTDAAGVQKAVLEFSQFSKRNEESISKLFVALLSKLLSVENLWEHGLCASTYDGTWISKTWKSKIASISVEDFLDRTQNIARAVGEKEKWKIYKCIRDSFNHVSRFMQGQIEAPQLRSLLFGPIPWDFSSAQLIRKKGKNRKKSRKRELPVGGSPSAAPAPKPAKRRRSSEVSAAAPLGPIPAKGAPDSKATGLVPLPTRSVPPGPISAKRQQNYKATGELRWSHYTTPATNLLPGPLSLRPFFAPQLSYQVHHQGSSSVPSQSGYALQHYPRPPVAHPQPGHQVHPQGSLFVPSQSGYTLQHQLQKHPRPPVAHPQPGHQVHHQGSLFLPSQSGYALQHHDGLPVTPLLSHHQVHHPGSSSFPSQSGHALQHHPRPPVSPQPSYQVHHLGPSSLPSQSGYGFQHHERPPVHHLGPSVPSQSGYELQHHPRPPVAPQPSYQPSSVPSQSGYGFQHHPRPPVGPQYPQLPSTHFDYGLEHLRRSAASSPFHRGWQHHQSDQNHRFRRFDSPLSHR